MYKLGHVSSAAEITELPHLSIVLGIRHEVGDIAATSHLCAWQGNPPQVRLRFL